jgi:hypothetical protein
MIAPSKDGICVVVMNPGLVAAALFGFQNSAPVLRKQWMGGRRPAWVRSSSRNVRTLVIDAALPTLADGSFDTDEARRKMARLGMDGSSEIVVAGKIAVAARIDSVRQILSFAADEGILADAATSFAAVELCDFIKNGGVGDCARVALYENEAVLTSRIGGRLTSRRFSLPAGSVELSSTLQMLGSVKTSVSGTGDVSSFMPSQASFDDIREGDAAKTFAALMERGAGLWAEEALAVFSIKERSSVNAAMRWLPPVALALAILCVAAAFPLWASYSRACEYARQASAFEKRESHIEERARENAPLMERIETLSRRRNARADELSQSRRVVESVLAVQSAMKTTRHVSIDSVEASDGGGSLAIAGNVARGTTGELDRFVTSLAKSGYKPSGRISMEESGAGVRFCMELEGAK